MLNLTERLGWASRSFALATRSLLIVVQMGYRGPARPAPFSARRRVNELFNLEPKLYAYDKATGTLLAEIPLPLNATGAPMTYMVNGKQYVAFAVGGASIPEELIALSLPSSE
jgi:quinoprotein glucose dehydrogenase